MRRLWAAGLSLALSAPLAGCFAHARGELVYDHPVEYVESAPARVEQYPRTDYHGRPAYLVEGRWYYPVNQRWVVFREEPAELREYRVRRAPASAAPSRGYGRYSQALSAPRSSDPRSSDRRLADKRAAERRQDMQRAERHRRAERASEERRKAERREEKEAAERRADKRRNDDDRRTEHRAQEGERVSQRGASDARDRPRARRDRRTRDDEPSKRRRDRDD